MISHFEVDLVSDIAGLIGGAVLVKPALRANGLAKQRFKLENIRLTDEDHKVIHELRTRPVSASVGRFLPGKEPTNGP